jgi:hypothetical protein
MRVILTLVLLTQQNKSKCTSTQTQTQSYYPRKRVSLEELFGNGRQAEVSRSS